MNDIELNQLEHRRISVGTGEMIVLMYETMVGLIVLLMFVSGLGFGNILQKILDVGLCVDVLILILTLMANVSPIRFFPIALLIVANLAAYWGMQYGYLVAFGSFARWVFFFAVPTVYSVVGYASAMIVMALLGTNTDDDPVRSIFG